MYEIGMKWSIKLSYIELNDGFNINIVMLNEYDFCFAMVGSEEVNSFKGLVYHGKIWKNAQPGDVVEVDQPVYVRNRLGLAGGM